MEEIKLGVVESRFAEIVWREEPLSSRRLVELCEQELHWKKSTTYTVLKKFCDRKIFRNEKGTVTSLLSKRELSGMQSENFVDSVFDGSLPAFIAAFTQRKPLSAEEIAEIRKMIDSAEEG